MAQKKTLAVLRLEGTLPEYSTDGGTTWRRMPGVSSLQTEVAESETQTVSDFYAQTSYTTPAQTVSDATMEIAAYLPQTGFAADMEASRERGLTYGFRFTAAERPIYGPSGAGVTAAIAAVTGVVTLAGDGADFAGGSTIAVGHALKMAGKYYVIDGIDLDDAGDLAADGLRVLPVPAADVPAGSYSVVNPRMVARFDGEVRNFGAGTGSRDGAYGTQLVVTPTAPLTRIWRAAPPA